MTTRRLPLFPLPLVLFPRAPQPLHIFEPRYRRLLADVLDSTREFGMILRTADTAERAIAPGTVGCVAFVESAQSLPDGRSNLLVSGRERFTLQRFVDDEAPYHIGEVEPFTDLEEPAEASREIAQRVRDIFQRVGRAVRTMQDDRTPLPELPDDPALLSFAVAQHVELTLGDKQELLASPSPNARLHRLAQILSPFVDSVELRAMVHERARGNGHGAQ